VPVHSPGSGISAVATVSVPGVREVNVPAPEPPQADSHSPIAAMADTHPSPPSVATFTLGTLTVTTLSEVVALVECRALRPGRLRACAQDRWRMKVLGVRMTSSRAGRTLLTPLLAAALVLCGACGRSFGDTTAVAPLLIPADANPLVASSVTE